jgi:4-alpha-glucanotransferase
VSRLSRGWFDELPYWQKRCVWDYLRRPAGDSREISAALIDLAWSSSAGLAIAPLQDLLNLGNDARMNVPGRAEGNWRWRCSEDMLAPATFQWLGELTQTTQRACDNVAAASQMQVAQ